MNSRSAAAPAPSARGGVPGGRPGAGFTLLELVVVMTVAALTMAIGAQGYSLYLTRTAASRGAETFARDLTMARGQAVRNRQPVVLRVDEALKEYVVVTSDGDTILSRDYGAGEDIRLDSLDLEIAGDSLVFNGRGMAQIGGAKGSLGTAVFKAGTARYTVSFNSMGASRVDAS